MRRHGSRINNRSANSSETGMKFKLITEPAIEPIDISEIKIYHRINGTDQDVLIQSMITAARQVVENYTGLALINQTWEAVTSDWFAPLELRGNVSAVESVTYYGTDGEQYDLSSDNYYLFSHGLVSELHLADGVSLPTMARRPDAITVMMTIGYGALASDVPKAIWQAMMLLFGHFYENRESSTPINVRQLPGFAGMDTVSALLSPYRVPVVR